MSEIYILESLTVLGGVFVIFQILFGSDSSLAGVLESTNETYGVLQLDANLCRPIQGVSGEIIRMVPESVQLFPFPVEGIKRHFVCRLSGTGKRHDTVISTTISATVMPVRQDEALWNPTSTKNEELSSESSLANETAISSTENPPSQTSLEPGIETSQARTTSETLACKLDPRGVQYWGNLSQTLSGRTCQKWTSGTPHNHYYTKLLYPNSGLGDHNYCRNPSDTFTAWCYTTEPGVKWEFCAVGDFHPQCTVTPIGGAECYTTVTATDYRGNVSVTRNNIPCQNWSSQTPHSHSYTPSAYPDAGLGDHNLCRNPGDSADFAWCYTTSETTTWDFCNIEVRQENCDANADK